MSLLTWYLIGLACVGFVIWYEHKILRIRIKSVNVDDVMMILCLSLGGPIMLLFVAYFMYESHTANTSNFFNKILDVLHKIRKYEVYTNKNNIPTLEVDEDDPYEGTEISRTSSYRGSQRSTLGED